MSQFVILDLFIHPIRIYGYILLALFLWRTPTNTPSKAEVHNMDVVFVPGMVRADRNSLQFLVPKADTYLLSYLNSRAEGFKNNFKKRLIENK